MQIDYTNLAEFSKVTSRQLEEETAGAVPVPSLESQQRQPASVPDTQWIAIEEPIHARIQRLRSKLQDILVGRNEMIDAVLASLVSGVPLVIFGPPGTAKSICIRLISEYCLPGASDDGESDSDSDNPRSRISKSFFEYLITAHTMPEEIFGPPDIIELQKGRFRRRTKGMLPESEFAFLDEIFRGEGHILNTLLAVVNERMYHNGAELMKIPLIGVIAAANHAPTTPDLAAFYDRFPVRLWIDSILDHGNPHKSQDASRLLNRSLDLDYGKLRASSGIKPEPVACTNDFRMATRLLARRHFGNQPNEDHPPRFREFTEILFRLRDRHAISDRSIALLWKFGAALDWIRGDDCERPFSDPSQKNGKGHLDVLGMIGATESEARQCREKVRSFKDGQPQTAAM